MKLPFVGPSDVSRSLAAAASEMTNLYVEIIENPADQAKNAANLFLTPGRHSLVDLSISGRVRGYWSGGGRLFVCVGTTIYELDSAGATVSSHVLPGSPGSNGKPVQMFGNGNQLGIVADGYFYIDNGIPPPLISYGPLQARFQIAGVMTVVTVAGVTTATWTGGDKFPTAIAGIYILISGVPNYVISRTNSTTIVLTDPMGSGGGTCATFPGPPVGAIGSDGLVTTEPKGTVYWQSGTLFTSAWEGLPIVIGGTSYTVDQVIGPFVLTLTTNALAQATAQVFSVVQTNLIWSGAAGALVTAVTGGYLDGSFYVQRPSASPIAYTDLVIGATTTNVTSAANPFNETQIDEIIIITGGAGFTAGTYVVASVDWAHVATLNAVVGVAASVGGTGTGYPPDLGRQVNYSAVGDGTNWRGLDFFTKEGAADYIRGILVDSEVLYVLGTETTEAWATDKSNGIPARIGGAMQKYGAISSWGMAGINSKVYFMGGDAQGNLIAYRIDGFAPTRISTHAQEESWRGLGTDCISYTYMEDGHTFWVINFGSGNFAWAWDETSKTWARRASWSGTAFAAYPTNFHTYVSEWDKHITGGDFTGGVVYVSSNTFYDDNGSDMAWRRAIPYRYNAGNQIYHGRMTLELEAGQAPAFTVASATAASPAVLTKVAHGFTTGMIRSFSGATGNWTPLNGVAWTVTVLTANTFSVPLDSTGFGALTGTVVLEPVITRDYSDNRGQTFANPQTAGIGAHDVFSRRVYWPCGGSSRGRVWRFFGVGQSKVALIDLEAEEVLGTV